MDTVKVWRVLLLDAVSKAHSCYRRILVDGRRYFIKNAEKRAFFSCFFLIDALSTRGVDAASKKGRRERERTSITIVRVLSTASRPLEKNSGNFPKKTVERGARGGKKRRPNESAAEKAKRRNCVKPFLKEEKGSAVNSRISETND